jgi:hypothetical protein
LVPYGARTGKIKYERCRKGGAMKKIIAYVLAGSFICNNAWAAEEQTSTAITNLKDVRNIEVYVPGEEHPKIMQGDAILITRSDKQTMHQVDSSGVIMYPGVGKMKVAGLTTDDLMVLIQKNSGQKVGVTNLSTQSSVKDVVITEGVAVIGEVQLPGIYKPERLMHVLAQARGMTDNASGRVVVYKRNQRPKVIYLRDIFIGEAEKDIVLQDGDVAWVQISGSSKFVKGVEPWSRVIGNVAQVILSVLAVHFAFNPD